MKMKIEEQLRKLIKPFIPTPPTLSHYKIGFTDELAPVMTLTLVLFFPVTGNHDSNFVAHLEASLQKVLTHFYPLAGRYVEERHVIECNDQGVEFIHAKANITLHDILGPEVNFKLVDEFIPLETDHTGSHQFTDPLLKTQVTTFECGGAALGLRVTHRIVDASTLSTFINEWAVMNRQENEAKLMNGPGFNSSSLFPARGLHPFGGGPSWSISNEVLSRYVTKKFLFSESSISNIRANFSTHQYSKVQLVSAIIWKALIGLDRVLHNNPRESILFQPINLRGKTASLIPKHSCGNIWGIFATKSRFAETTEALADNLKQSVKENINNYLKIYHGSEESKTMIINSFAQVKNFPDTANVVSLTSWCDFPFYEADFGFGEPIWVTCGSIPVKNTAYLMDDAGGNGVEAIICMEVNDVPYFEQALKIDI